MGTTLIFFPATGEMYDVTSAPESEVEISRRESFLRKEYTWLIYINEKNVKK